MGNFFERGVRFFVEMIGLCKLRLQLNAGERRANLMRNVANKLFALANRGIDAR